MLTVNDDLATRMASSGTVYISLGALVDPGTIDECKAAMTGANEAASELPPALDRVQPDPEGRLPAIMEESRHFRGSTRLVVVLPEAAPEEGSRIAMPAYAVHILEQLGTDPRGFYGVHSESGLRRDQSQLSGAIVISHDEDFVALAQAAGAKTVFANGQDVTPEDDAPHMQTSAPLNALQAIVMTRRAIGEADSARVWANYHASTASGRVTAPFRLARRGITGLARLAGGFGQAGKKGAAEADMPGAEALSPEKR